MISAVRLICGLVIVSVVNGCSAPSARLSFPAQAMEHSTQIEWFDVDHHGRKDFAMTYTPEGRADAVQYDDNADGQPDRTYHLADYENDSVPHVILLLDSIPFDTLKERYDAGDFRWFSPPVKIIAPFPSLTELCYSDVLHAPPLPGVIDQYYDPKLNERSSFFWAHVWGDARSWERRCDYIMPFMQQGMAYLDPRKWYAAELEQARRTVDESPYKTVIVYLGSASGMVSKYGKAGAEEVLDGARQFCLQLLYERHGAIKISMMADHGHNYTESTNIPLAQLLSAAGFHPTDHPKTDDDVFLEINGLVTCAGIHTKRPADVAATLIRDKRIELAMYLDGDRAMILGFGGSAAIEMHGTKLRYRDISGDILQLNSLVKELQSKGLADAEGYIADPIWFEQTLDHPWPDAPRRIWDALHRQVINPPTVFLSIKDGYYAGLPEYEKFIKMASTHGGLNQVNSATFLMTMTGRAIHSVHHQDVLSTIAPGFEPRVRPVK